jgi:hypothetical protein
MKRKNGRASRHGTAETKAHGHGDGTEKDSLKGAKEDSPGLGRRSFRAENEKPLPDAPAQRRPSARRKDAGQRPVLFDQEKGYKNKAAPGIMMCAPQKVA